jgi:hypothetical protein
MKAISTSFLFATVALAANGQYKFPLGTGYRDKEVTYAA